MPASGYDSRPGGRQTFAFTAPPPAETRSLLDGRSRGPSMQGGDSRGGVVNATPQTFADPTTSSVPAFLEKAMEPYIQRKQQEALDKGYDAAASGKAYEEIAKSDSGVSQIFGPSYFKQGAAMYKATSGVDATNTALLNDPDLYKLGDADRTAEISRRYRQLLSGDPLADSLIQHKIVETRSAVVGALAKKNYAFGQEEGVRQASGAVDASASSYQALGVTQSALSSPTDADRSGLRQAHATFLASLQKPAGMADASYQRLLFSSAANMQAQGNFYAFEALRSAGLLKPGGPLTDEQIDRLEKGYSSNANRVLAQAAHDPAIATARIALDADIKLGRIKAPLEAAARLEAINGMVAAKTGIVGVSLYDAGAVTNVASAVTDAVVASARRQEEHQWQLEDRAAQWQHEADVKAQETAQVAAQVHAMWASGTATTGVAAGVGKAEDYNAVAGQAWEKGDYASLASNFNRESYVSPLVQRRAQAKITSTLGKEYSKDFATAHQQWQALDAASPGAAAAYYGPYNVRMKAFDGMVKGGITPALAYVKSFGDPLRYDIANVPPQIRKAVAEQIPAAIDGMDRSWTHPLRYRLNGSARATLTGAIANEVAIYSHNTDMAVPALVGQAIATGRAAGHFETAGSFAWRNPDGAAPLTRIVGAQPEEVDRAFTSVVDRKLKAAGYSEGAGGDNYTVMRVPDEHGRALIYLAGFNGDGSGTVETLVSSDDLKAEIGSATRAKLERQQPQPVFPVSTAADRERNRKRNAAF